MAHFVLRLLVPSAMRTLYAPLVEKHEKMLATNAYFDAGFDLLCPVDLEVDGFGTERFDHGVKASMTFYATADTVIGTGLPVGYFLYPRSSTGAKTPLRLANSVGVIDAGYRGNLIAIFDNQRGKPYKVEAGQRLVQVCPPNLTYPMKVELVEIFGLDEVTVRGEGGLGSTGK
jgi:dUTP pyrophosphatase